MALWRVGFTVYLDEGQTASELNNLETVVEAHQSEQAMAQVRAQYGRGTHIWYCQPA